MIKVARGKNQAFTSEFGGDFKEKLNMVLPCILTRLF